MEGIAAAAAIEAARGSDENINEVPCRAFLGYPQAPKKATPSHNSLGGKLQLFSMVSPKGLQQLLNCVVLSPRGRTPDENSLGIIRIVCNDY